MLSRNNRRIAHRPDSIEGAEVPYAVIHGGHIVERKKPKKGIRIGYRLSIPRIRVRLCSLLILMGKVRQSCGRMIATKLYQRDHARSKFVSNKQRYGVTTSGNYSGNAYYADAIADCIEFIKRSASTESAILC